MQLDYKLHSNHIDRDDLHITQNDLHHAHNFSSIKTISFIPFMLILSKAGVVVFIVRLMIWI